MGFSIKDWHSSFFQRATIGMIAKIAGFRRGGYREDDRDADEPCGFRPVAFIVAKHKQLSSTGTTNVVNSAPVLRQKDGLISLSPEWVKVCLQRGA